MDTLAHCGLTSPVRQSLKLPGHHIGLPWLRVQGSLGVRQAPSQLGQPAQGQPQDPWPYRESPSWALWTSAPRIVREYAAAGSRVGEIASSMPTLSDVAMLPLYRDKRGNQKSLSTWQPVQSTRHARSPTHDQGHQRASTEQASRATRERGRPSSVSMCQLAW